MKQVVLFSAAAALMLAGAAHGQIKCWNENGKRVCGDAPPAGARVTTLKVPSGPADAPSSPAAKDGDKGAKRGPLTPAEQEQEYRRRQAEAQKAAEKAEAERKNAENKRDNCERAKEALRSYESGQRIMRTAANGERVFLDDSQIAQEAAKARQVMQDSCN
jgi:hypothetical protein